MEEQNLKLSREKADLFLALAKKRFPDIDLSAFKIDGQSVLLSHEDVEIILERAAKRLHELNIETALLNGEREKTLKLKEKISGKTI